MKRKFKIFVVIALLLSFVFMSVGYAQLTDELIISGIAVNAAQTGVFISTIETSAASAGASIDIDDYTGTILNSTVSLGSNGSSTLTLSIRLHNNSAYGYIFNGVVIGEGEEFYDNENILFELANLSKGDEIDPYGNRDFTVKFSYDNKSMLSDVDLHSIIKFEFVLASDYIPDFAADSATSCFEQILDTPDEYSALIAQMDKHTDNRNDESYIGNVFGATTEDSTFLNGLFIDEDGNSLLTLDLGNGETHVTVLIKREDVDGNTATGDSDGNEMTIYMTADDLSNLGGSWWQSTSVQVFAAVYTKGAENDWYQLGEMYEGSATANNYATGWYGSKNSFDTDTWRTALTYYGRPAGRTIEQIISDYKSSLSN